MRLLAQRTGADCHARSLLQAPSSCRGRIWSARCSFGPKLLPALSFKQWRSLVARATAAPPQDVASGVVDAEDNEDSTTFTVRSSGGGNKMHALTGVFSMFDVSVMEVNVSFDDQGNSLDVFRVTTEEGTPVSKEIKPKLIDQIERVASASSQSIIPAVYGMAAAAEVKRLRPEGGQESDTVTEACSPDLGSTRALELAAAEMADAAAKLVTLEREIAQSALLSTDSELQATEEERREAAAVLERKMSAMEAVLVARRNRPAPPPALAASEPAPVSQKLLETMKPPDEKRSTGPAAGSGHELLLQGFNWESCKAKHYKVLREQAPQIAAAGYTCIWLPPPSDAVSPQGYLPRDLYLLDSAYGTEQELRDCIDELKRWNLKVIADIVINHRCAHKQDSTGRWNQFGGRLAWDESAVCCNNAAFGGKGHHKTGEDYTAAPNIDHTQEHIQQDIISWLQFLKDNVGFDGWRFDFTKGYHGRFTKLYVDATVPEMAFGEFWDTCSYTDCVLNYNQDGHRQRTIDWIDATGGTCAAFDFTTKGILQEAVSRNEYWRLVDAQGRPPGLIGLWASRAITFVENHDTGSTLNHWPFPWDHLQEGYAYILTHPGTPCVFYDHHWQDKGGLGQRVRELLAVRKQCGINTHSKVTVRRATADVYAATIDDCLAMKIGFGEYSPNRDTSIDLKVERWECTVSGVNFAVWVDQKLVQATSKAKE